MTIHQPDGEQMSIYDAAMKYKDAGVYVEFNATVRIDTLVEVEYFRNGEILHTVLRKLVRRS